MHLAANSMVLSQMLDAERLTACDQTVYHPRDHSTMPREPRTKGQGNLSRKDVDAHGIRVFEEARTRAGYLTQKARMVSASGRPKSPSKSPTKQSGSPRKLFSSPPQADSQPLPGNQETFGRLRSRGKVSTFLIILLQSDTYSA